MLGDEMGQDIVSAAGRIRQQREHFAPIKSFNRIGKLAEQNASQNRTRKRQSDRSPKSEAHLGTFDFKLLYTPAAWDAFLGQFGK